MALQLRLNLILREICSFLLRCSMSAVQFNALRSNDFTCREHAFYGNPKLYVRTESTLFQFGSNGLNISESQLSNHNAIISVPHLWRLDMHIVWKKGITLHIYLKTHQITRKTLVLLVQIETRGMAEKQVSILKAKRKETEEWIKPH